MERINAHLGRVLVTQLRFVQDWHAGAAASAAAPPGQPAPVEVPGMPPGPLRDALSALGAAVRDRSSRDRA